MTWFELLPVIFGCAIYCALIFWLLWPLLTKRSEIRNHKIRLTAGCWMLGSLFLPLLALPLILAAFFTEFRPFLYAPLDVRYILVGAYSHLANNRAYKEAIALRVRVEYVAEFDGVRISSVEEMHCFQKRSVRHYSIIKNSGSALLGRLRYSPNAVVSVGEAMLVELPDGNILTAENRQSVCRRMLNGEISTGDYFGSRRERAKIYFIDRIGKQSEITTFSIADKKLSSHGIIVYPPKILSVVEVSARSVFSENAMNPFVLEKNILSPPLVLSISRTSNKARKNYISD